MKAWSSIWPTKKKGEASTRPLNLFDLLTVGIGGSLAFGIWVLVGHLIRNVAGPAMVVSICLAGAAALAGGGMCFAEVAVRFLKADSTYVYCYLDSDQNGAFVFGWAILLQYLAGAASGAKGFVAFIDSLTEHKISDFLGRVTPLTDFDSFRHFDFISLIVVAVFVIFAAIGMKHTVKKIFTTVNIFLIVAVVMAGAFKADLKNWYLEGTLLGDEPEAKFTPFGLLGVAKGATMAFYGFLGFDTVSITGSEVKKRKINIPLAIAITVIFSLMAYAGVGSVLTLMMPYHKHDAYAAVPFAFQQAEWIALKWIVVVATFFGFYTSLFGVTFALRRILLSMANDGLLFPFLGGQKRRSSIAATSTSALLAALAAGFLPFEELVNVAVLAALFVFIYFATHLILRRYHPTSSNVTESSSQSCFMTGKNSDCDVSMKSLVRSYFNFSDKFPTNVTKKIIIGNIISFSLSSIGITIIFRLFHEPLIDCAVEAVVPAGILLSILFLNVISITFQPKSEENVPFKVPLVPLLPCLSIFLNIFLMQSFKPLTWILFFIWFALGLIPYSVCCCVKHYRKESNKNSLYEINKSNAIKLNESIWKIKSNKKSFYEGAVNPVFLNDDDIYVHGNPILDQIEKIEPVQGKETKSLENPLQLKFAYTEHEEIENESSEVENVRWECVAEIHEEVELPTETIALEIVDNTYKFLSEISKNDGLQAAAEDSNSPKSETSSTVSKGSLQSEPEKPEQLPFKEELFSKIKSGRQSTKYTENTDENQNPGEKNDVSSSKTDANNNADPQEMISDEQNKAKRFKEKLNQLLKNQINGGTTFAKKLQLSNSHVIDDGGNRQMSDGETDKNILHNSMKTLNKSQIKGELEFLLSKGPPKRSTLGSSFNIKIKETGDERESNEPEVEKNNGQNDQKTNDEISVKTEKLFPLKNTDFSNDVNC